MRLRRGPGGARVPGAPGSLPGPDAPPLPAGYQPIARLAQGRRTETWDAWDTARECRCVIKRLRADRLADADPQEAARLRAAVLTEGEILTTLGHPHLVRGFEVVDGPAPAVVLETVTGHTLGAVLDDGPLVVADMALLGLQLTSVLGWLHRHDWLHLDLKPANVVVEAGRAVLVDLGLAARPGPGRPGAGTPGYLAPEQARGDHLGPATDVWGLGTVLLECLTAESPRDDDTGNDTDVDTGDGTADDTDGERRWWRRVGVAPAARPTAKLPPEVAPEVAAVLHACRRPDPAERPGLAELRAVLGRLASDR